MATANGSTSPEELASLADLVGHLEGKKPLPGALSTRLGVHRAARPGRHGRGARPRDRQDAAQGVSRASSPTRRRTRSASSDLESNPDEEDLADLLVEALELDEIAADLENEVNEALMTA